MFSTPSVRPCLAAATPPAVSVEDRRSQESLHVHAGGLCDMGANWRGKGGGGRDNAALPLVTRGWLCLRMECTAVTSHIRVFFCFCFVFYQRPCARLVHNFSIRRRDSESRIQNFSLTVFKGPMLYSRNVSLCRWTPHKWGKAHLWFSFVGSFSPDKCMRWSTQFLENQPLVTSQRAPSPRRYLSSVSERHLVPPSDYKGPTKRQCSTSLQNKLAFWVEAVNRGVSKYTALWNSPEPLSLFFFFWWWWLMAWRRSTAIQADKLKIWSCPWDL